MFVIGLVGQVGTHQSIGWPPQRPGVMVGFGITSIFMQGFNYLLDSYLNLYVSRLAHGLNSLAC
jgi:DHA1 family multidrug resistance protein-like MFS transporter